MSTDLTTAVLARTDKCEKWFAVKRAKSSAYHFYAPRADNLKTIEAIAPDGGNFEVVELVDCARLLPLIRELCAELEAAEAALAQTIRHCGADLCTFPLCEADCFIEVNKVRLRLAKFRESLK